MKILFICKGNYFRSQMAAAICNKLTHTNDADSVGTYTGASDEPEGQILSDLFLDPGFFEVMELHGMNVRNNSTKKLLPEMLKESNIVVSMAEEPYIPNFLKEDPKVIWWDIENPAFVTRKVAEDTYNKLDIRIRELITKQLLPK